MIETLNQIMDDGAQRKIFHNFTSSNSEIPNSHIIIDNHQMTNFGSCSYLGLEKHNDLNDGVINAVSKYGTQFSSSRTYLSHYLYRELEEGFFLNVASFPAVPMRKSGIRFMINTFLNKEQINEMLMVLCDVYTEKIIENGTSYAKISKTFDIPNFNLKKDHTITQYDALLNHEIYRSIKDLDEQQWNSKFINDATLSYANLELLEDIYTKANSQEHNWEFYYLVVKDNSNNIVLMTFITVALTKDDTFSEPHVSEKIEQERTNNNPYYLTSKTVLTGSLITKGNHVYINYEHENWKNALSILSEKLTDIQDRSNASKIMIRDFYDSQLLNLDTFMLEKGFIKYQLPNNMVINDLKWSNIDEYLSSLSQKYRYNVRKEILKYESNFIVNYSKPKSKEEIRILYKLYENVYKKSFMVNVFKLPLEYFKQMSSSENYDVIKLYLKNPKNENDIKLVGVAFNCVDNSNYDALIVGLDYEYVYEYNCYKQILFQTVIRAKNLGCKKLDLGFSAELEKKKLGAQPVNVFAYVQASEHLTRSILEFS